MRLIPIILNHTLVIKTNLHQGFLNTMVLASWVSFWTPKPLKSTSKDTQEVLWGISLNINLKQKIEFFHLHIIPTTFYKLRITCLILINIKLHVYSWIWVYPSTLLSPLKIWTPQNFIIANFRHPVSNSWLRPWLTPKCTNGCWNQWFKERF